MAFYSAVKLLLIIWNCKLESVCLSQCVHKMHNVANFQILRLYKHVCQAIVFLPPWSELPWHPTIFMGFSNLQYFWYFSKQWYKVEVVQGSHLIE